MRHHTPSRTHLSNFRAAGLLALGLSLGACSQPAPQLPTPEVTVAAAVNREVADVDEFTGHVAGVQSREVRPTVSGFVQRVMFAEGALVRQGDPLFAIDARPYETEV